MRMEIIMLEYLWMINDIHNHNLNLLILWMIIIQTLLPLHPPPLHRSDTVCMRMDRSMSVVGRMICVMDMVHHWIRMEPNMLVDGRMIGDTERESCIILPH